MFYLCDSHVCNFLKYILWNFGRLFTGMNMWIFLPSLHCCDWDLSLGSVITFLGSGVISRSYQNFSLLTLYFSRTPPCAPSSPPHWHTHSFATIGWRWLFKAITTFVERRWEHKGENRIWENKWPEAWGQNMMLWIDTEYSRRTLTKRYHSGANQESSLGVLIVDFASWRGRVTVEWRSGWLSSFSLWPGSCEVVSNNTEGTGGGADSLVWEQKPS